VILSRIVPDIGATAAAFVRSCGESSGARAVRAASVAHGIQIKPGGDEGVNEYSQSEEIFFEFAPPVL
jgi:hypothetical protein